MNIMDTIFKNCRRLYLLDFPTNGFNPDLVEASVKKILSLYNLPKLLVTVSLDGPPELHDTIRGVTGAWERAVETFRRLRLLRSRRFDVFLGMTLQPANADKFPETFEAVRQRIGDLAYRDFHINLLQRSAHYYANIGIAGIADKEKLWNQLRDIDKPRKSLNPVALLEKRYQHLARIYLEKNETPIPCQAMGASFFMSADGTVYPCSIYNSPVGNVADFGYDIYKLWESAERVKCREQICQKQCPQCWTPCEAYQSILANLFNLL